MRDRTFFFENGPRAILLFHAYTSTPNDMRSLGRALERANYTVYAPTFKGHGTADPDDILSARPEDWVNDGREALKFLRDKGYEEIAVFGLSLGGVVATKLLLEESVVAGGTFASPIVDNRKIRIAENFWPFYEYMKKKAGHSASRIEVMKEDAEPKFEETMSELQELVASMVPQYGEVTKPVFIAQGGQDEMIDPHTAGEFRDLLTDAKVDFHWYEEAPHVLTVGEPGKQLQLDLLTFLSTINWNGGE
ncbi:alpha/beta hydrolase [Atopococcus tabaci]|uniref:alpha/beta hydrolase n=1 Tax=Atopococcus tabaci TaxID=269774 RepID=UPI0003FB5834|nr:alpha/beta fold hydrolase [Atopococcus tabaci]